MKIKFKIFFLFFLILFNLNFVFAALTNTTLINETFDSGDLSNWTTDWDISTTQFVSSPNSLEASSDDSTLVSIDLDMSDADLFYVSFRYRIDSIDANDNINLYYFDGTTYDIIDEIGDDEEGTWLTFSQTISDSQYFINDFKIQIDGTSIDNNEFLWIDNLVISKQSDENNAPALSNVTVSSLTVKGGSTITIYANSTNHGVNDTDGDTLFLYCDTSDTPTSVNNDCTGGTTTDSTDPYDLSCTFSVSLDDTAHQEFCRIYDGLTYSSVVDANYTTDSTAPSLSITSVAGDSSASYFDVLNDGRSDIIVSGESDMSCRWSTSDVSYSAMSNSCSISGSSANCSVNDVVSQGFTTRYISCQDQLTNENNASNNLNVNFFLDYTVPTTSDNSNTNVQTPPYQITITEQDNVDSDPTTLYCADTTGSCTPSLAVDDGGIITFTSLNRGQNYLRYFSTDDAGNIQTTTNKSIVINQLPLFSSASDNAITIKGGTTVNISTVTYEPNGQQLTLYVCDSASASFSGCDDGEYCSSSASTNVSCTFTSETDSSSHTWYAYVFDDSDEGSLDNPFSGSYTTDYTSPSITVVSPSNNSIITQNLVTFRINVNEALSSGFYSLDGGINNVSLANSSLLSYLHTNSSIADGSYNVTFFVNDTLNNLASLSGISFTIDSTADDETAPEIDILSPVNNSYLTSSSVLLNITTDEDASWVGFYNSSGNLIELQNYTLTNWNLTIDFVEGQDNLTFFANDSSSNKNQGNDTITFYVDLSNPSVDSFDCFSDPVSDNSNLTCYANLTDFVGLDYIVFGSNATGNWVNSTQQDLSGNSQNISYSFFSGNYTPGFFTIESYLYDLSGRNNLTSSNLITVVDDTFPLLSNISYFPNESDDLDPGVSVNVNVSIFEDYKYGEVYLMYQNLSSGVWNFVNMTNQSALVGNSSIVFSGSFVPQNGTWFFQINATDLQGNQNISANTSFDITEDISFWNSTNITSISSLTFSQRTNNNSLGSVFLNNTGDSTLEFELNVTSNLRSRFDIDFTGTPNTTYSLASGENKSIQVLVNSTSLPAAIYDYNLSITSSAGNTNFERRLNVQTAIGPYLVVAIPTFDSSVNIGEEVQYISKVENLGTQDSSGTYLNWTLPEGWTLSSGSLNRDLGVIPIGLSGTNTITVNVGSSVGSFEIYAEATANEAISANASVSINVTSENAVSGASSSSSGGGGGGGISSTPKIYSKVIEIVRGNETKFEITINNRYKNDTLENLTLMLDGFLTQYLSFSPETIGRIDPGKSKSFTLLVKAPTYKSYEEFDLIATISGIRLESSGKKANYLEKQKINLIIQETSDEEVIFSLSEAEKAIEQMKFYNFNVDEVESLLEEANLRISQNKNKEAQDLANQIIVLKNYSFEVYNEIFLVSESILDPKKSLITGSFSLDFIGGDNFYPLSSITGKTYFASDSVVELVNLAILAFERGDYDLSQQRIQESRNLLVLERKGNLLFFFYLYWQLIIFSLILAITFGVVGYNNYRRFSIGRRIRSLNYSESNLIKLFQKTQEKYFTGKISSQDYHREMHKYQQNLAKLKKNRLTLRNKRIKLLKPEEILIELNVEKMQIESEIKKLQKSYYVSQSISENDYKFGFKSFNERLAEIEKEKTTLDLINLKKNKTELVKK